MASRDRGRVENSMTFLSRISRKDQWGIVKETQRVIFLCINDPLLGCLERTHASSSEGCSRSVFPV